MAPDRLMLDTDIVIHLLKKQPQTVARFIGLLEAQSVILLSPIVVAEIHAANFKAGYKVQTLGFVPHHQPTLASFNSR